MMKIRQIRTLLLLLSISAVVAVSPNKKAHLYEEGDELHVNAVKLFSEQYQLSYTFYQTPLHCKPKDGKISYQKPSLGEFLSGDRLMSTEFKINVNEDVSCRVLCGPKSFDRREVNSIRLFIRQHYRAVLTADNLLGVQRAEQNARKFEIGYPLGIEEADDKQIVTNHVRFVFKYNRDHSWSARMLQIVDFTVEPMSVSGVEIHGDGSCALPLLKRNLYLLASDVQLNSSFTYEVVWEASEQSWTHRWDRYIRSYTRRINSFSVFNSIMIVGFVAAALALFLCRMVRKDIVQYNSQIDDDIVDESGWKLTHGDVFRPPHARLALCVLVGSGTQLLLSLTGVSVLAFIGWVSPAIRGSISTAGLVLYVLGGVLSGFWIGRLYKSIDGKRWKRSALYTALTFPALTFGIILFVSAIASAKQSSSVITTSWLFGLVFGWLGLVLPTVMAGYYLGFRKQPYTFPFRPNRIPRIIPKQPRYLNHLYTALLGGILPFSVLFVQLHFVYEALWRNGIYVFCGYMLVALFLYVISVAEVSIFTTYRILQKEDYRWWWKSFTAPAGTAFYMLLFSIYYYFVVLKMYAVTSLVSKIFYFGYASLICVTVGLLSGTVGFWSSFVFVRQIFSYLKLD